MEVKVPMLRFIPKSAISTRAGQINHYRDSEAIRLLYSYRYGSLLITSVFYFAQGPVSLLSFKIPVAVCLYFATRMITDMYVRCLASPDKLRVIILLETLVITLLLIPTGGLDSPFIWYALNPVLVAASYFSPWFCWFNLFLYIGTAGLVTAALFHRGRPIHVLAEYSYLLMVFVLVTLLVQLLSTLLKRLKVANAKQRESLEHIMSLYQIIEAFTAEDHLDNFFHTFTDYATKLTKARMSFFWENTDSFEKGRLHTNTGIDEGLKSALCRKIETGLKESGGNISELNLKVADRIFYAVPVKSSAVFHGVLGIEAGGLGRNQEEITKRQMVFLSELSAIVLERFLMEEVNDKLLLLEERNRIANEIHDSVSQRLFSIASALYILKNNWGKMTGNEICEQLTRIGDSANTAMGELRRSIYSLSSQKTGEKIFFSGIKAYLSDLAHLNGINISTELTGDEEILPARLKKCLYRIITETTGNAVKHGKSSAIRVRLNVEPKITRLLIEDNGVGFDPDKLSSQDSGLGLVNIRNIVRSLGGEFTLDSRSNAGTKVKIEIPYLHFDSQKQGGLGNEIKTGSCG